MKRKLFIIILILICLLSCSCATVQSSAQVVATTGPVFQFAERLCQGTGIEVTQLITENVSCLHDYTLQVSQMHAVESAEVMIISGAGLEEFMEDLLDGKQTIDASQGIAALESCHSHEHEENHGHHHELDSHIWLSPENAMVMAENICTGLSAKYPQYTAIFETNLAVLLSQLQELLDYGKQQLSGLSCREIITFHDGFAYFAHSFGLEILAAVEEESGSETSAHQLIELIQLVHQHDLSAIFTETNGSDASATVIAAETGAALYTLDMAMAGDDYFAAMRHNIDVLREALQ